MKEKYRFIDDSLVLIKIPVVNRKKKQEIPFEQVVKN